MDFAMMFDRQHTPEGLVCLQSILDHGGSTVYVLCLEEAVEQALAGKEHAIPVVLSDLEGQYPSIAATRAGRPWAAYVQSLKSFLLSYVLVKYNVAALTYVDSDMLFWSTCSALGTELGDSSFLVTPYGKDHDSPLSYFNAGFVACRADQNSATFLAWWQARCVEWCLWEPASGGRFVDEGYLTVLHDEPNRFAGVKICQHPGINLAAWNVKKHVVESVNGVIVIDGIFPLVCFHYQGFRKAAIEYQAPVDVPEAVADLLYRPYHELLPVWTPVQPLGHSPEFPSSVPEDLLDFPVLDRDIQLQATAYECVPESLLSGARADEILAPALQTVSSRAPAVLIKFNGQIVGFFVPRGMNGSYEMPIFIAPEWRNRGIGRRVVELYMTGRRGHVAIWVNNVMAKKAYAAAGFVRRDDMVYKVNGRSAEIWVKEKD